MGDFTWEKECWVKEIVVIDGINNQDQINL